MASIPEQVVAEALSQESPGDNYSICDAAGCNQRIHGTRYKCLDCHDFDYCPSCHANASLCHPGHVFEKSEAERTDSAEGVAVKTAKTKLCASCASVTCFIAALIYDCKSPNPTKPTRQLLESPSASAKICYPWHLRLSALIEATQRGCAFCCFCLDSFYRSTNVILTTREPTKSWCAEPLAHDEKREALVKHCMNTLKTLKRDDFVFMACPSRTKTNGHFPDIDKLEIWASMEETARYQDMSSLEHVFNTPGVVEASFNVYAAKDSPAAKDISNRPPNPSPGSHEAFEQVRTWMKECLEKHGGLCTAPHSPPLPSRVIDVSDPASIRILQPGPGQQGQYVALSYCWGGKQQFCTLSTTLDEFAKGFPQSKLPQTIQDAVRVARELGFRYLWVDSLCIIQDDEGDKAYEISKMGSIYKNASLTVGASKAQTASSGFLDSYADPDTGLWPELLALQYPVLNAETKIVEDNIQLSYDEVDALYLSTRFELGSDALKNWISQRGWCLQEKLLSRRFLSYDRWTTWRCSRATWTDGGLYLTDSKTPSEERRLVNTLTRPLGANADLFLTMQLQKNWYSMLNDYTRRDLGLPEDRLPGIGGIAAEMGRITGVGYVAGLWKNNLLHDLMWQVKTREFESRPAKWRAPSWSWASVECPLKYGIITDDAVPLARVIDCHAEPAPPSTTPFGQIASGRLEISGPMAVIAREDVVELLRSQGMAAPPPKSNRPGEWYQQIMAMIQDMPKLKAPGEDDGWEEKLPETVYGLLTFTWDGWERHENQTDEPCYFGLLLKESGQGQFERIGAFFNEKSNWTRQEEQPWEERTIVVV